MGKSGKRVLIGALAFAMAFTGLMPGGTQQALALIAADRIETIDTSVWSPIAPGPTGIAYRPETNSLIVVDGDAAPTVNLWEYSLTTGQVLYSASIDVNGDATGLSWDSTNDVLYVSSDSSPQGIYMFQPSGAGEGQFGGTDDGFISVEPMVGGPGLLADVEDPVFDGTNLFFLNGNTSRVYEIAPNAGGFGDGDDTIVTAGGFPVPADPSLTETPTDWEGMTLDGANLLIGVKDPSDDSTEEQGIWVVSKTGVFMDRIDTAVIANELGEVPPLTISGLTVQPAGGGEPKTYWIADRGDYNPVTINDGRLHRIHPGQVVVPDEAPEITPAIPAQSGNENSLITFQATAEDDFGDEMTWSLDAGFPAGATINPTTGIFTWTPTEAQGRGAPAYTVRVRVDDSLPGDNTDFQDVMITANEVNQAPVMVNNPDVLRAEGESVSMLQSATDADVPAQTKTWSATGLPPGLGINTSTGTISGTIAAGATSGSPYNVTLTVRDNGTPQLQDQDVFVFSVTDTNRSPVLAAIGNKSVMQGSLLAFKANATDPDGDGLSFSLVSPPAGAAITAAGNFTWTPNVAPGNYPVTVRVTDNGAPVLTDQETITVTVQASNDANPFIDDDGHIFENAIEWLDANGITAGCNPPINNRFCPNDNVTRGQMATFLVRALHYTVIADDYFIDDNGNIFENAINRLRTAGVTQGCNPPTNNRFCPDGFVTRGQMAAFLVRALDLPAFNGPDRFVDDDGHVFEGAIERLAQAGITLGCNPPANDRFCPNDRVTRGQMAAFLKRALEG